MVALVFQGEHVAPLPQSSLLRLGYDGSSEEDKPTISHLSCSGDLAHNREFGSSGPHGQDAHFIARLVPIGHLSCCPDNCTQKTLGPGSELELVEGMSSASQVVRVAKRADA